MHLLFEAANRQMQPSPFSLISATLIEFSLAALEVWTAKLFKGGCPYVYNFCMRSWHMIHGLLFDGIC